MTRAYVPLLHRVAAINALLLTAAVALTVVVLAPKKISVLALDGEVLVVLAAVALVVLVNVYLLRRVIRPLQALIVFARGVDYSTLDHRIEGAEPTSEAGELALTFNEMLARLQDERRESTGRVLRAQEAERLRIAQELHDQVGQELTAVLLGLSRVASRAPSCLEEDVLAIQDAVRDGLKDVRRIAIQLRPEALDDLGLTSALAVLADRFSEQLGLEVSEHIPGRPPALAARGRTRRLPRCPGGADQCRSALGQQPGRPDALLRCRSPAPDRARPRPRLAAGEPAGYRDAGNARARHADRGEPGHRQPYPRARLRGPARGTARGYRTSAK